MILDLIFKSLIGIFVFTLFSFLCAFLLAFLVHLFEKEESDGKMDRVIKHLPGLDCGECGYSNCSEYAYKVAYDKEDLDKCMPGNKAILHKIRNRNLKNNKNAMVAKIACLATNTSSDTEYIFDGADDCYTLFHHFSGDKKCKVGCMGRGDCQKVCSMNAIKIDSQGRVWIDSGICSGCGKCILVCPTKVIKLVPLNGGHFIACSNNEEESHMKEKCKWGCTGCKTCEHFSNNGSVKVKENLATISYSDNHIDLQNIASKCPTKVIVPIKTQKAYLFSLKEQTSSSEKS